MTIKLAKYNKAQSYIGWALVNPDFTEAYYNEDGGGWEYDVEYITINEGDYNKQFTLFPNREDANNELDLMLEAAPDMYEGWQLVYLQVSVGSAISVLE